MPDQPAIVIVASLDTKAAEARLIAEQLEAAGEQVLTIDFGTFDASGMAPDISAAQVCAAAGADILLLRAAADRGRVLDAMCRGVAAIVRRLHADKKIAGVIGFGGSGGTLVGSAAMRALPFGFPKLLVSTIASGDVRAYVDISDICMLNSVVDFVGINPISETVLRNAASAIAGMVRARRQQPPSTGKSASLIAATMFGVTTPLVEKCRRLLEPAGHTVVAFHATGTGGRSMDSLIADGLFRAVLDLTPTEWADEVVGGTLSAGPTRMEAAARAGIPQVIAPGALDMVNFGGAGGLPARFQGRRIHRHDENMTLMRTTVEENTEIGRRVMEKLNASTGPVAILFPCKGISAIDIAGNPFYDADADAALLAAFRANAAAHVEIQELDLHINDDAFADACCRKLLSFLRSS